jgi:predicted dehydrogenase
MSLRVAVIGVGHWHAARHLESLLDADVTIVGVSDPDQSVAARVGAGLGCPAFGDHHALLESTRPEFVAAMPRPYQGAAVVGDVLDAGLPLAVEKPIGLNAAEIEPLVAKARRLDIYTAVPFVNRYNRLWEAIGAGRGGSLHASFRIVNGPPQRYADWGCGWMLDPALAGGGAMRNLGIHGADAALMLAGGGKVEVLDARVSFAAHGLAVEDYALAVVRVPDGPIVTIEAGYTFPNAAAGMTRGGDSEWRVATSAGYAIERGGQTTLVTAAGEETLPPSPISAYRRFTADAVECFRAGRQPIADIADCWRAVALVDEIYRKAGAPWMPPRR